MARTGGSGAAGISAFIVPAGLPGLSLGKPDKKMGQRGTKTCDVILDKVRVPASHIIGGEAGKGFKTAMKVLDRGRLHVSALACGMAHRILQESVSCAQQRKQFGQRIGDFQLVQSMLADSQAERQAGGRRPGRRGAGGRAGAGAGVSWPRGTGVRSRRTARGHARSDPGVGRHAAPAATDRPGSGTRADPDGPAQERQGVGSVGPVRCGGDGRPGPRRRAPPNWPSGSCSRPCVEPARR